MQIFFLRCDANMMISLTTGCLRRLKAHGRSAAKRRTADAFNIEDPVRCTINKCK